MALGDPVIVDLPNVTFLLNSETGVIIEMEDRDIDAKLKEIFDASAGYVVGYVFYDFVANMNWSAILNGTTGFAAAQPGVSLTMANSLGVGANQNGVSSGGIYTKPGLKITHQGEDLRKISGTAFQRQFVA